MQDEDRCWRVWWDAEAGLVHCDWLPGAVCGIDEARAVHADVEALAQGEVLLLVDLTEVDSIDRDARQYFMGRDHYRAVALLAGSASTRMLANFFLGLKRRPTPAKMFTAERDAIEWLRAQA